jgi:hypothetical protein
MGYEVVLLALIAVLAGPFAFWIHRRRERWRHPRLAIALVGAVATFVVFGVSAANGYFYPYGGPPGREVPGLRAAAEACGARYALARTARDTAAVDPMVMPHDTSQPYVGLSCGTLRRNRLPGCQRGTRCARLKAWLGLPGA